MASELIALTHADFPYQVVSLRSEPVDDLTRLSAYELYLDTAVTSDFDNGWSTWHLPFNPELSGAEAWVLSFVRIEGARRAFQILAEPKPASRVDQLTLSAEQDLSIGTLGDRSATLSYTVTDESTAETWTSFRVIGRIDRVVIMVTGTNPLSSEYAQFTTLLATMVNRVVQVGNAPPVQGSARDDDQG
ncbi:MAG: hypothetical protein IIB33_00670 [Chloroflexi bacterium]|nr:hypothetical protein [Chloroflexota bacterium]